MTVTPDISGDWQYVDGVMTVTIAHGTETATSVIGTTKNPVTLKDIQMLGATVGLNLSNTRFSLPVPNLSNFVPRDGDKIIDSDEVAWTVLNAELIAFRSIWTCLCVKRQQQ